MGIAAEVQVEDDIHCVVVKTGRYISCLNNQHSKEAGVKLRCVRTIFKTFNRPSNTALTKQLKLNELTRE
jgi:hypothetical protein